MEENSIEEDIKDIKKYISFTSKRENFSHDTDWNWNKDLANKIEHILSDYKRVLKINEVLLKENELLKKDIEGWKKYCEEIEEEQTKMSNKNCELEFEVEKLQKENEKLRNNNKDLLRKLRNRVKEVKKLEKYSAYKKEFSTLNKKLQQKEKIINELAPRVYLTEEEREEMKEYIWNSNKAKDFSSFVKQYFEKKVEKEK